MHSNNSTSDNFYDDFLDGSDQNKTIIKLGCKEEWCHHQHKVYLFQYLIGLPTVTIGYCASSLLCYTLFSKIIGPWPQVKELV